MLLQVDHSELYFIHDKLQVQVGAHTDRLYDKEDLKRFPEIVFSFPVMSTTVKVANPFGGLLFIRVSANAWSAAVKDTLKLGQILSKT